MSKRKGKCPLILLVGSEIFMDREKKRAESAGFRVVKVPHHRISTFSIYVFPIISPFRFLSLLRMLKPNVVHVYNVTTAMVAVPLCKLLKIPVIVHNLEIWSLNALQFGRTLIIKALGLFLFFILEALVLHIADVVIVVSKTFMKQIYRMYRVNLQKVVIIRNILPELKNLPCPIPDLREDTLTLVYAGVLHKDRIKIMENVIRSVALTRNPKIRLIVVGSELGSTSPPERLKRLTKKLGVADQVTFTGWVSRKEALTYLSNAQICLVIDDYKGIFTRFVAPTKIYDYLRVCNLTISFPSYSIIEDFPDTILYTDYEPRRFASLLNRLFKIFHKKEFKNKIIKVRNQAISKLYKMEEEDRKTLINVYYKLIKMCK